MKSIFAVSLVAIAITLASVGSASAQAPSVAPYYPPLETPYSTPNQTPYSPPSAVADVTSGDYCPWHSPLLSLADVLGFPCACDTGACQSLWSVAVDGVYMQRTNTYDTPLVYRQSDGGIVLSDNNLHKDFHTGMRLTATRQWANSCEFELTYMGVDGLGGTASIGDPSQLYAPNLGPIELVGGGRLNVTYQSKLHTGEFLLRHRQDWLGYSAGLRFLNFQDMLSETRVSNALPPVNLWRTDANNFLIGLQGGIDVTLWQRSERFRANVAMKFGVYDNHTSQLSQTTVGGYSEVSSGTDLAAYVGELDFTASWKLSPHLAVRSGYQLMWIDNVSLASQQIYVASPATGLTDIDTQGRVFAHGATVGVEVTY